MTDEGVKITPKGKLYCLLFLDNLDFDAAWERFSEFIEKSARDNCGDEGLAVMVPKDGGHCVTVATEEPKKRRK